MLEPRGFRNGDSNPERANAVMSEAFLQLALPGLLKLAGRQPPALDSVVVRLAKTVHGQEDWTQFIEGRFQAVNGQASFYPEKMASRLQSMGDAEVILMIPEGTSTIDEGGLVAVQVLPGVRMNSSR
jgi:molybdopterin molybdotransferase